MQTLRPQPSPPAGALAHRLRAAAQRRMADAEAPRLALRLVNPPVPLTAPSEAARLAARHGGALVSVVGVVTGLGPTLQRIASRRLRCPFCLAPCDVPDGAAGMPCCGCDTEAAEEDVPCRWGGGRAFPHQLACRLRANSSQ